MMPIFDAIALWWADALLRASVQGGIAIALAGLLLHAARLIRSGGLPPATEAWIWRAALAKTLCGALLPVTLTVSAAGFGAAAAGAPGFASAVAPSAGEAMPMPLPRAILAMSLAMAAVSLTALLRDDRRLRRLRRESSPCVRGELLRQARDIDRRLNLSARRMPVILESRDLDRPLLIAAAAALWRRGGAAIILPAAMLDAAEGDPAARRAIGAVLAHELAHARRRDLAWAWLAWACGTIFFFHPLVWATRSALRRAQDEACDALALRSATSSAGEYGTLLLRLARTCPSSAAAPQPAEPLGAGAIESFRALRRRLLRLGSPAAPLTMRAVIALALLGALAGPTWRLRAAQPIAAAAPSPPELVATAEPGPRAALSAFAPARAPRLAAPLHDSDARSASSLASSTAVRQPIGPATSNQPLRRETAPGSPTGPRGAGHLPMQGDVP